MLFHHPWGESWVSPEDGGAHTAYSMEGARSRAMDEHAMLLRCEGLLLKDIADRFGLSRNRVNERIHRAAKSLRRAMSRTKFRWDQ